MKNFAKSLINLSKPLKQTSRFMFSNKTSQKLCTQLKTEINYEQDNFVKDQEILRTVRQNGFEVIDNEDKVKVKFFKKQGDRDVIISFFQQAAPETQDQDQQQEEQNQQDFDFQIDIINDNKGISFDCFYVGDQYEIAYVSNVDDYKTFKTLNHDQRDMKYYSGPKFETLEDDLKEKYYDYVESLGINLDLIEAMEKYALDKEQQLYITWLKKMNEFMRH